MTKEEIKNLVASDLDGKQKQLPVVDFVVDLLEKMKWDVFTNDLDTAGKVRRFFFNVDYNCVQFNIKGFRRFCVILSGYNYAYQVKLVMDLFGEAGFFD